MKNKSLFIRVGSDKSINFSDPWIFPVIFPPKFLVCGSLKNQGKSHRKFPQIPKMMLNIGLNTQFV